MDLPELASLIDLSLGSPQPVLLVPHPMLATVSDEVDPTDPATIQLAADLVATQLAAPGSVGIAANQIGVAARVFSVDVSAHPKTKTTHGHFVLVNAKILSATRWSKGREGCMSVPDFTGDVKRATRLTVTGQLPGTGEEVTFETDAFEARAIQHELDHVDGLTFLDRVAGAHAIYPRKNYLPQSSATEETN